MRSSIPSALLELTTSKETGWASARASAAIDCAATANSASASSPVSGSAASPAGRPDSRALQELDGSLGGAGHHRREGDAGEVERGGDRDHVEIADRHDAPFRQDDRGVSRGGVQLSLDRAPGKSQGVPGRAEDLGDAPEGERVLQVPGVTGLEQGAPGEQRAEAAARRGQARVGSDLGDHGMEDTEVTREPLESQRGGDLGFPEQPFSGELSQPGPPGGEGVVIDQRQAFVFLQDESGLAEQPLSEVGQRTQISLPHRTEAAHGRRDTTVQGVDDHLGEFGAHPGRTFGVTVHQAGHRGPHHRRWGGRSLGDQVIPDQGLAEASAARSVERDALSLGDRGRQAINGRLRSHGLLDNLPGLGHPVTRRRGKDGPVPPLGDGREGLDRQRRAVKHHH